MMFNGPWRVGGVNIDDGSREIVDSHGDSVADVVGTYCSGDHKDDGRDDFATLIAAAPDLYSATREAIEAWDIALESGGLSAESEGDLRAKKARAVAALAKARGGA